MSFDIPVVQVFPQPKSMLLFKQLGLKRYIFPSILSLPRLVWFMLCKKAIQESNPSATIAEYEHVIRDSENHLKELARIVSNVHFS